LRGWMEHCVRQHPCMQTEPPMLPKRVLHVGSPLYGWKIKLQISSCNARGQYAALSHCWGRKQIIKTTRRTLADRMSGIPWDSLPKTFQDAITMARGLGLEYLWIDSLCILQDDVNDWDIQFSLMASIYREATLLIAATASEDGDGGCFPPCAGKIEFLGRDAGQTPFSVFARRTTGHQGFHYHNHSRGYKPTTDNKINQFPLLSRAWAFQEHILARTIVHCLDEELVWECLNCSQCECGMLTPPNHLQDRRRLALRDLSQGGFLGDTWDWIVRDYSRKEMTFAKDKLPALSAFAKRVGDSSKDTYLAGLWRSDLLRTLTWACDGTKTSSSSEPDKSAPFWSWASTTG
ncbi:HET-domain-containing protein, partial [Lophiostoma macrostomum CBS 122681]